MESHGVPAECPEASSHTVRWKAREEEATSCHRQRDELEERHQTVAEEVTRISTWTVMDQMDTDTSRMD
jgi:hypothetical protein